MNVYLYGGSDRFNAITPITDQNEQVVLDQEYTVDADVGFLLIAYPDEDAETEFEFTFNLGSYATPPPVVIDEEEEEEDDDETEEETEVIVVDQEESEEIIDDQEGEEVDDEL